MKAGRRATLAVAAALASLVPFPTAPAAELGPTGAIELPLPRVARSGEAIWVTIVLGRLPQGAEIDVRTADDELVGTVSPFGGTAAREGAGYTIPLPASAIAAGRVTLNLKVIQPGAAARPPSPGEVERVELTYVPVD